MTTLATLDDIEDRLGRDLTDDELVRADALETDVAGSVQLYTGQKFLRDDYALRTRVKRGVVRLPQRPVHTVDSVKDRFGEDVEYEFDGIDRIHVTTLVWSGRPPLQVVDIEYDAGPETVPPVIVGIVCQIVLRTLGRAPTDGAVTSESIDNYTYRLASASGSGSYGLTEDEMRTLDSFRRVGGTARVT